MADLTQITDQVRQIREAYEVGKILNEGDEVLRRLSIETRIGDTLIASMKHQFLRYTLYGKLDWSVPIRKTMEAEREVQKALTFLKPLPPNPYSDRVCTGVQELLRKMNPREMLTGGSSLAIGWATFKGFIGLPLEIIAVSGLGAKALAVGLVVTAGLAGVGLGYGLNKTFTAMASAITGHETTMGDVAYNLQPDIVQEFIYDPRTYLKQGLTTLLISSGKNAIIFLQ